jgi:hypothetical protein
MDYVVERGLNAGGKAFRILHMSLPMALTYVRQP